MTILVFQQFPKCPIPLAHYIANWTILCPGNTNWRGWLGTVGLLIKVAGFVKKKVMLANIKSTWSKLVSTRRSNVL